jgi:hypothetical protein
MGEEDGSDGRGGNNLRKYTPHEIYHLEAGEDEEDDVPLQLLTAEEKIDEL